MPQYPMVALVATNASHRPAYIQPTIGSAVLGLSANVAISTVPVRLSKVFVAVAGASAASFYDCTAAAGTGTGNLIATVPNTVGQYTIDWPCNTGLTVNIATNKLQITLA